MKEERGTSDILAGSRTLLSRASQNITNKLQSRVLTDIVFARMWLLVCSCRATGADFVAFVNAKAAPSWHDISLSLLLAT